MRISHDDIVDPALYADELRLHQMLAEFCIGLALARLEMKHFFKEFASRVEQIELTEPTTWVKTNFLGGPKSMKVKCTFGS